MSIMYSENIKYYQTHSKPASTAWARTCCLPSLPLKKLHQAALLLFIFGIQILTSPGWVLLHAMVLSLSPLLASISVAPPSLSQGEGLPKEAPTRTIRISRLEPSCQHPHTGIGTKLTKCIRHMAYTEWWKNLRLYVEHQLRNKRACNSVELDTSWHPDSVSKGQHRWNWQTKAMQHRHLRRPSV